MGFSISRSKIKEKWENIPKDIHFLITHMPPLGIFDLETSSRNNYGICPICNVEHINKRHIGCSHLLKKVKELNENNSLIAHFYGHSHKTQGVKNFIFNENKNPLIFSNGSVLYHHKQILLRNPNVILIDYDSFDKNSLLTENNEKFINKNFSNETNCCVQ